MTAQDGWGTGTFFSSQPYLLTCYHVIENAINIFVDFPVLPNSPSNIPATVVAADPMCDLALIKLSIPDEEKIEVPYVQLIPEIHHGEICFSSGFSVDGLFHLGEGIIASSSDPNKIVVTNLTDHGVSGGPCVGAGYRNLIGIVRGPFCIGQ